MLKQCHNFITMISIKNYKIYKKYLMDKQNISRDEIAEAMKNEFGLIESYVWV